RQALAVLRNVLAALPRDTRISIRVFGHKKPTVASANPDPAAKEAEDTRATPSEQVFKGRVNWSRENPGPLQGLMERLAGLYQQWGTPLLRSMEEAKAEDFPEDAVSRTLVVLTDGADTSHPKATRVAEVGKHFREAFADGTVAVHMVLFRMDQQEEADARN